MELYIGGYAQGKLRYVLKESGRGLESVVDGALEDLADIGQEKEIINRFHEWFFLKLQLKEEPEKIIEQILSNRKDLIIISNEVGCGIVPMEEEQRQYRERLGRCLCDIAKKADRVERIICGLGQRIK
ncbi:bifunctional adenosylcobinamide kinase/adenosylcobinamide-phosphate guanylyltransferase [Kineothrix sedimenti]|uniref:Adenosylcobinamide kinase n=1 Tax=Kineothrix sedimenti TaxID=3123317 RepID=A0ABZ3EZE5_9FIRM